ncbi:polyprenyl diphosphate synthase [Amycolatopsis sp. NPDC059021]|uniref:polyprenyl diphosphate synthase n=1 Tax=Amycolatopsis sp. NPDC059021 TaxID=3346704 RepID=UPI00366D6C38
MGPAAIAYGQYTRRLRATVRRGPVPEHVAMVMDGNRRWARDQGLDDVSLGHRRGFEHVVEVLRWCDAVGVGHVTLFWASIDNLAKRAAPEAAALMRTIERVVPVLATTGRRVDLAGHIDLLPDTTVRVLKEAAEDTRGISAPTLTLAVGYDGRVEIADAVRCLLEDAARDNRSLRELAAELTPDVIATHLYTSGKPDPDLVIRTSGEQRLSGFLTWQAAFSQLQCIDVYWPGFREIDFLRALRTYAARRTSSTH